MLTEVDFCAIGKGSFLHRTANAGRLVFRWFCDGHFKISPFIVGFFYFTMY